MIRSNGLTGRTSSPTQAVAVAAQDHDRVRMLMPLQRRIAAWLHLEIAHFAGQAAFVEQHLAGDVLERCAAVLLVGLVGHGIPAEPARGAARNSCGGCSMSIMQPSAIAVIGHGAGKRRSLPGIRSRASSRLPPISNIVSGAVEIKYFGDPVQGHAAGGNRQRVRLARIGGQDRGRSPGSSRSVRHGWGRSPRRRPPGGTACRSAVRARCGQRRRGWVGEERHIRELRVTAPAPQGSRRPSGRDHRAVQPASRASVRLRAQLVEIARQAGDVTGRVAGHTHGARDRRRRRLRRGRRSGCTSWSARPWSSLTKSRPPRANRSASSARGARVADLAV